MAGLIPVPPLQQEVATNEALEELLCGKGLKVVELYSTWCGPCKSVQPTLRRIRLDKDDENALKFLTVPCEAVDYLEAAKEHRGNSQPLFLLYRNGAQKGKVKGSNAPELGALILAHTPANADMDDLDENPLYQARLEKERQARGETNAKEGKSKKESKKK